LVDYLRTCFNNLKLCGGKNKKPSPLLLLKA
jgi:hypothetical protein